MKLQDCYIGLTVEIDHDYNTKQYLFLNKIRANQAIPSAKDCLGGPVFHPEEYTEALLAYNAYNFPTKVDEDRFFFKQSGSGNVLVLTESQKYTIKAIL